MPFPDSVPTLTDGVVRLRAHAKRDVDRIVEQCRDPQSLRWTSVPRDYTREMAQEWLGVIADGWDAEDGSANKLWAIEEVADETGAFSGTIDLRPREAGRAEIGFGLHPDARNRGLMVRALRLVQHWWFEQGGQRVDWYAERGNFASWAVARAAGYTFVATLPEHIAHGEGGLADAWFATLGRDDDGEPTEPWFQPPILVADGIRLRPWTDDDAEFVEEPDHAPHHVPDRAIPRPDTFAEWLLKRRENLSRGIGYNWCIADAETDRPLGDVCLFGFDTGRDGVSGSGELGYVLFPSARGRGAASTAARLVSDWALAPVAEAGLGLDRLTAVTASDNAPSNRILETLGFTRWGHEAQATAPDGSIGPADHWEKLGPARPQPSNWVSSGHGPTVPNRPIG
ncbi:RimJ/RimL family protein N-acetyltransferase [Knoellia remsis]|uniref:RimJ/RimL family protein N-acetyltransferase n=1 Tax=Knoellia remsis TaxID=407159 RepID=A0A2T0UTM7_9MICO|nr:GNAT family N-acetyltransferase [Knoellia remsis]PRY61254.1 RimJ/RimL family protein N-acetyltransferase [Knoellia remsis]